jgi:hypothetical protein
MSSTFFEPFLKRFEATRPLYATVTHLGNIAGLPAYAWRGATIARGRLALSLMEGRLKRVDSRPSTRSGQALGGNDRVH